MHVVADEFLENVFESEHSVPFDQLTVEKTTYLVPFMGKQATRKLDVLEWLSDNIYQRKPEISYRQTHNWVRLDPLYIETEFK